MASSSLQEIIASIGFPVAGNPTQFVMERAFHAAGVDSRCLTVDVPPEALEAAIVGMKAMGFRGGVLADPHQQAACQYVARLDGAALLLQEMDVIYRDDDDLVGTNATARAITGIVGATDRPRGATGCDSGQ